MPFFFVPFRPGSPAARRMFWISVPVAVVIGVLGIVMEAGRSVGADLFLVLWVVVLVGIVGANYRSLYLGRGSYAEAMQTIYDKRHGAGG